MTQDEINERKAKSNEKFLARKTKQDQEITKIKKEIKYLHDNRIPTFRGKIAGLDVTIAFLPNGRIENSMLFESYYTVCSPKDIWSKRKAKHLLYERIKQTKDHMVFDFIADIEDINDLKKLASIAFGQLTALASMNAHMIDSETLRRACKKNLQIRRF